MQSEGGSRSFDLKQPTFSLTRMGLWAEPKPSRFGRRVLVQFASANERGTDTCRNGLMVVETRGRANCPQVIDDQLRTAQKENFQQWISRQTDAEDADTFALHAYIAGENAATSTRATGLFHSRYLLRNYKGNPNIANQS